MTNGDGSTQADTVETELLRIKVGLRDPAAWDCGDALLAALEIHNKRPVLARVDAGASYLMDEKLGAENLVTADRVLPPEGWVRINSLRLPISAGNLAIMLIGNKDGPDLSGHPQTVRISVKWEDGVVEPVDIDYRLVRDTPVAAQ
ncbi:MAG: hypothetical protein HUU22_19615 [Phycisphaerae bacterium]|nr:hypothetical protein [Phycisphaerae bacterium]NUQ48228.1 hypothetical protein [Phycisphaerae bacterium]